MDNCVTVTFLMPEPSALATKQAQKTGDSYLAWYDALIKGIEYAEASTIDPDALLMLAESSKRPEQFLLVMEALREYTKENPYGVNAFNLLAYYIDQTRYGLESWVDALEYFYSWLNKNNRHASLETILNYVTGCTQDCLDPSVSLRGGLKRVLDLYGLPD